MKDPNDVSQCGEGKVIKEFFSKNPAVRKVFVDVGAHGNNLSNTWRLAAEDKWSGILVEANPHRIKSIEDDFRGLKVEIVCAAVGGQYGVSKFYIHNMSEINSLLPTLRPQNIHHHILVVVTPLSEILKACNVPVDFDLLSVDVEGVDLQVMERFFQDGLYHPMLIVVETDKWQNADEFFESHGYDRAMKDVYRGFNSFYLKRN